MNYPFEPSIAFKQATFTAAEIDNIDPTGYPPTIKIRDELLFVRATQQDALKKFAADNNLTTVDRPDLWSWILEPFLDTEFTDETDNRLKIRLAEYGLTEEIVISLRQAVGTQMVKYNFDTMLWDWTHLGAFDVLSAMSTKYNKAAYQDFYKNVMRIALMNKF
ncbi:MAG: hypothetical protein NW218_06230 [Saprospiraceae bacterium]|nr:hypothetical protein [Saprospiraceae bacterium]